MKKVLIIEDDRFEADDLQFFVKAEGHQCEVYNTATDVVNNLPEIGKYDVIVLDIMMRKGPQLKKVSQDMETGELLFELIREKYPDIDILVISAKNFRNMKIKFRKEENVHTLKKPVNEQFIIDLLRLIGK